MAEWCQLEVPFYHVGVYFCSSGRARRSLAAAPGWVHPQVAGPGGKKTEARLRGAEHRGCFTLGGRPEAGPGTVLSSARAEGRALPHRLPRERGELRRSRRQSSSLTWRAARQRLSGARRYSSGKGLVGFLLATGSCPGASVWVVCDWVECRRWWGAAQCHCLFCRRWWGAARCHCLFCLTGLRGCFHWCVTMLCFMKRRDLGGAWAHASARPRSSQKHICWLLTKELDAGLFSVYRSFFGKWWLKRGAYSYSCQRQ